MWAITIELVDVDLILFYQHFLQHCYCENMKRFQIIPWDDNDGVWRIEDGWKLNLSKEEDTQYAMCYVDEM